MSALDHIEYVSITIGSAATSATKDPLGTTLTDTDKSFIIPSFRCASNQPAQAHCRVNITSTTVVTATRNNSGDTIDVGGYLLEFSSGITVQRGTSLGTGTGEGDRDIDIDDTFDLGKSFLVWSFEEDGGTYGADDGVRAYLFDSGAGDLKIKFGDGGVGNNKVRDIEWQVVELDDCTVYRDTGTTSMGTSTATATDEVTAVTLSRAFMVFSATWDNGTSTDIGQKCLSGGFTDTDTIDFLRDNTGQAINAIVWEVVELSSDWSVQEITGAQAASTASSSLTSGGGDFTALTDYTKAFTLSSYLYKGGNADYSSDDIVGESWFTAQVTSNTNINIDRNVSNGAADFRGFVCEYTGGAAATPAHPQLGLLGVGA